ncbi:RNA-binding protein NOB1 isoform X2 [Latimeria chalumnae]|uniref:RNA-binding protein NOB1 isoform X2 n=1 Tax=Latimeria chalumnae TaxID=7897 RepID=UPI0003C10939|nr:PREDICTED: RNA-binding protein NOB1 isoform X2 [Latimeria chalumnae]|eukprot:XP_006006820.1 PREDICTED: RNA-binding protein NOB1 isoform X2 [Latimeria chalumnae]
MASSKTATVETYYKDIGKNIYTLKEVVREIRDKDTKRRLAVLPYQLCFKEPFPEYIRLVTEFSKKTGDYPSLSATDIKVLALTYQLEVENVGVDHLKKEPETNVQVSTTLRHPEAPVNIAGFYLPSKPKHHNEVHPEDKTASEHLGVSDEMPASENPEYSSFWYWRNPLPSIEADLQDILNAENAVVAKDASSVFEKLQDLNLSSEHHLCRNSVEEQNNEKAGVTPLDENSEEEEDEDDGGSWITPSNIKQIQQDMGSHEAPVDIKVGCLTTDFAMQNVLIQIGLHVLSVNGMLIRQARNYILRCHACFKATTNMTKVFCPNCGNKTLKKVAVTVDENGCVHMHFSRNPKVLNSTGLRYSLPAPKGGKHANNPHLVEDQRFPQQRLSKKARQKTNVFDPDYIAGVSPFAENDTYSRSANLNVRDSHLGAGRRRMNPNVTMKKFVKRK